jgi:hypothetical protein
MACLAGEGSKPVANVESHIGSCTATDGIYVSNLIYWIAEPTATMSGKPARTIVYSRVLPMMT